MKLDKRSPIPLYYQLAELIRDQIQSGELNAGVQLPSERDLSEQHGVSRMTVRQAVGYLAQDGWLQVKPGVGTFVAESKLTYDALHLLGFTEEMMWRGGEVTSHVLEQSVVTPPPRVAADLQLSRDEQTIRIVRLRHVARIPLLLETSYIPSALCPDLEEADLTTHSLYAVLEERYGLHLQWARQTLEASVANDYEQQLFELQSGISVIVLQGVTYDMGDRPVEYFKAIYRGDRFKFELESRRNDRGAEIVTTPRVSVVLA